MKPLILLALAVVAVILLRHREPVAVAPLRCRRRSGVPGTRECGLPRGHAAPHAAHALVPARDPDDLQPSDPYPASLLR